MNKQNIEYDFDNVIEPIEKINTCNKYARYTGGHVNSSGDSIWIQTQDPNIISNDNHHSSFFDFLNIFNCWSHCSCQHWHCPECYCPHCSCPECNCPHCICPDSNCPGF
jgi:hypothetical protein